MTNQAMRKTAKKDEFLQGFIGYESVIQSWSSVRKNLFFNCSESCPARPVISISQQLMGTMVKASSSAITPNQYLKCYLVTEHN